MTVIESAVTFLRSGLASGLMGKWTCPSLALRIVNRCLLLIPGTFWSCAVPTAGAHRVRNITHNMLFRHIDVSPVQERGKSRWVIVGSLNNIGKSTLNQHL